MRTAERVARNATYTFSAALVAFVAGAISSVVLARLFGPEEFGTYALVLSSVAILAMLVNLGVPHAVTKYVAEYDARGDRGTAARVVFSLGRLELVLACGIGAVAVAIAPLLARVFDVPGFVAPFRVAAVALVPGAAAAVALAGLQGLQDYRRVAFISLVGTLFALASTIGLVAAGAGATGALAALAASAAVSAGLAFRALARHGFGLRRTSLPPDAGEKVRRYVPAVSVVLLLDAVVWQRSEVIFLGVFRTAREVAWYALAFGAASAVMRLLPRALSFVLPPIASGLYGGDDRAGMQILFRMGSRYLTMLAAPVALIGSALARPLLETVYGESYGPAAAALPLVLLAAGFGAVGSVTASIQTGMERQDLVLKVAFAATAVDLLLDVALIPAWGVVGAAIANAAAQIAAVVAGITLTARIVHARFPAGDCLRVVAAAAVSGGVAYATSGAIGGTTGLLGGALAGCVVYAVALPASGALRAEDIDRLGSLVVVLPAWVRPAYGAALRLVARCAP